MPGDVAFETIGTTWLWIAFGALIVVMLAVDLGVLQRRAHEPSIREAAIWTAAWVGLSLLFAVFVAVRWGWPTAEAFLTGYLIEKALSVENLFVFYLTFAAFSVVPAYQHKVLFWGIVGAVGLRAVLVFGGTLLLQRIHWLVYAFGLLLVLTGVRMLGRRELPRPEESRLYGLIRRIIPTTRGHHAGAFFAREDGALKATPLLLVLVLVELTDLVFSIDSILAVLAISLDPFVVLTSNILAVMGMRSLYFLLARMVRRFSYLQPGLALVMMFVGAKMAASRFFHVPVWVSLVVVSVLLGGSIGASLVQARGVRETPEPPS